MLLLPNKVLYGYVPRRFLWKRADLTHPLSPAAGSLGVSCAGRFRLTRSFVDNQSFWEKCSSTAGAGLELLHMLLPDSIEAVIQTFFLFELWRPDTGL